MILVSFTIINADGFWCQACIMQELLCITSVIAFLQHDLSDADSLGYRAAAFYKKNCIRQMPAHMSSAAVSLYPKGTCTLLVLPLVLQ